MTPHKVQLFNEYIDYMSHSNKTYSAVGRYLMQVRDFLESGHPVTRKGYRDYIKDIACDLANKPYAREAICDFLNQIGVKNASKNYERRLKPLEKLSDISERNKKLLNDFVYHLTQNEDYSPHTLTLYSNSIKKFFLYANEFSVDNCKRFVSMLETEGFSPQTIRLRITALEKFSRWLKKPIELKRPKFKRKLNTENVPTEAEYNRLLEFLSSRPNRDYYFFIKILATTGARVSEFFQFRWEDILAGEVTLRGKGNKYRRFFFNKGLQDEVKSYVKEAGKQGYVAVGRFGRITQRGLCQNMKSWGDHCSIDRCKMHPHAFRHFFAKMFLKKNKDVIQLADLLGHGSVDTTRIYLQKSYAEQKRDFNRCVTW